MATQQFIDNLIVIIGNAEDPESVTNEMVAAVLDHLNTGYKDLLINNPALLSEKEERKAADEAIGNTITTIELAIQSLKSSIDALTGKNTSEAIESFNEIIEFLEGVKDDEKFVSKIKHINDSLVSLSGYVNDQDEQLQDLEDRMTVIEGVVKVSGVEDLDSVVDPGIYYFTIGEDSDNTLVVKNKRVEAPSGGLSSQIDVIQYLFAEDGLRYRTGICNTVTGNTTWDSWLSMGDLMARQEATDSRLRAITTVRFDGVNDQDYTSDTLIMSGDVEEVVYLSKEKRFAVKFSGQSGYYRRWPGVGDFMDSEDEVLKDKFFLCGNSLYVWDSVKEDLMPVNADVFNEKLKEYVKQITLTKGNTSTVLKPTNGNISIETLIDETELRGQYTMICSDLTVADDRNYSNCENHTGYDYGNDYQPSGHIVEILSKRFACAGKITAAGKISICKLHNSDNNAYYDENNPYLTSQPSYIIGQGNGSDGDIFVYEPRYWTKGINDYLGTFSNGIAKQYSCFSSIDNEPDISNLTKSLSLSQIKSGEDGSSFESHEKTSVDENLTITGWSDTSYDQYTVVVKGYKYVRFSSSVNCVPVFLDHNYNLCQGFERIVIPNDGSFIDGMYLIVKIPDDAKYLRFSTRNDCPFEDVVLSNSDRVEDMEPDWVFHNERLVGMFKAYNDSDLGLMSIKGYSPTSVADMGGYESIEPKAQQRGFQIIDWDTHNDIANLFFAKYGRRNVQDQCGYGKGSSSLVCGSTNGLGYRDTINKDNSTEYAWSSRKNDTTRYNSTRLLFYEDWYNGMWEILSNAESKYIDHHYEKTIKRYGGEKINYLLQDGGGFIKRIYHQRFMDLLPVNTGGTSSTYYCDQIDFCRTGKIARSGPNNNAMGGIISLDVPGATSSIISTTTRIMFRGEITLIENPQTYKNIPFPIMP